MTSSINVKSTAVDTVPSITKSADGTGTLALQTNSVSGLTIDTLQNITANSAGALGVPVGTTAQRPASPVNGMIRYSSSITVLEGYVNGAWKTIAGTPQYSVNYLIVAGGAGGGAGGGNGGGGGGGAGGLLENSTTFISGTTYTITVGAGGSAVTDDNANHVGGSGSNSVLSGTGITTVTSIGGATASSSMC